MEDEKHPNAPNDLRAKLDPSILEPQLYKAYKKSLENFNKPIINVLYIGKYIIGDMLNPFIKVLLESEGTEVTIATCYCENGRRFKSHPFVGSQLDTSDPRVSVKPLLKNEQQEQFPEFILEDLSLLKNFKFDFIFCNFELHSMLNWRKHLVFLLSSLENDGGLYFVELKGDVMILDGNFNTRFEHEETKGQQFKKAIYDFKKKRNEIFYWSPEIRISDYSPAQYFLATYFSNIQKTLCINKNSYFELTNKLLDEYHHCGCFDFLNKGLQEKELKIQFKDEKIKMSWGLNLYEFLGFNENRISNTDFSYIIESRVTTPFVKS